jgi:hypothetical protein
MREEGSLENTNAGGRSAVLRGLRTAAVIASVALLLYLASRYSYLFFHTVAELFSVIIAIGIFVIVWNVRRFVDNNYFLLIGIAYLFVGVLDVLHMLAYKGMGVFPGRGANLPTQLWIASRYLQALSLVIAPLSLKRTLKPPAVFWMFLLVTGLLISSIFAWNIFPVSYREGVGLTTFKKASEYVISAMLVAAAVLLMRRRDEFDAGVLRRLVLSVIATVAAELLFTFYIGVYDLSNLVGHYCKILSFYFMYEAVIRTALVDPHILLYRKLKQSEEALREERNRLQQHIDKVKVLQGLLPICASCKNVRDDKGYWSQVETYIEQHSSAHFTHGLCPDCARRLYPEIYKNGMPPDWGGRGQGSS